MQKSRKKTECKQSCLLALPGYLIKTQHVVCPRLQEKIIYLNEEQCWVMLSNTQGLLGPYKVGMDNMLQGKL